MDGKFYDVPDDQAHAFEVPRDQVKALLEKSGMPAPSGGQQVAPYSAQQPGQAPMQGPGGGHGPGPGMPQPTPPVVVNIYGAPPTGAPPSYGPPPGQQGGEQQPQGENEGDVNPYWWWRNVTFYPVYRPWFNGYWGNW
jgi:hypothetical protein